MLAPWLKPVMAARAVKFDDYVMPEIFKARGGASISVVRLLDWVVRDVRPALWDSAGGGGLLFASAVGPVVNLQLAQATARRREIAIRSATGAGTGRLARQLFVEALTLAIAGATAGMTLTALILPRAPRTLIRSRP